VDEPERLQQYLPCPSAEERAGVVHGGGLHHGDTRAAEDQEEARVLQVTVPVLLEDGGKGGILLDQVRKLVDRDHGPARRVLPEVLEEAVPVGKAGALEERVIEEVAQLLRELPELQHLRLLAGQEADPVAPLEKPVDEFTLPHASPAVEYEELGPISTIPRVEHGNLARAVEEDTHK